MQELAEGLHLGLRDGLRAGIALEDRQSRGPRGINKNLREFGKKHDQQSINLIFVAHHVITELLCNRISSREVATCSLGT